MPQLDPDSIIDTFHRAADANLNSSRRTGSLIHLPDCGRLLMTGDLHDHALNYRRILKLAELDESPNHFLILHELVHGQSHINGKDLSIRLLARAAALKCDYPDQVFIMQANHELAQIAGEGILKGNISVVEAFNAGVDYLFADAADDVLAAMEIFIRSLPLAVRCDNGIFCSHSLPSPRKIDIFDKTILDRVPTADDLDAAESGSAYLMVWGRHHTQKIADELAAAWDVKVFIMGHQPAEMGYETEGDNILILASDHDHGMALPIDLAALPTTAPADIRDILMEQLQPLAGVVV